MHRKMVAVAYIYLLISREVTALRNTEAEADDESQDKEDWVPTWGASPRPSPRKGVTLSRNGSEDDGWSLHSAMRTVLFKASSTGTLRRNKELSVASTGSSLVINIEGYDYTLLSDAKISMDIAKRKKGNFVLEIEGLVYKNRKNRYLKTFTVKNNFVGMLKIYGEDAIAEYVKTIRKTGRPTYTEKAFESVEAAADWLLSALVNLKQAGTCSAPRFEQKLVPGMKSLKKPLPPKCKFECTYDKDKDACLPKHFCVRVYDKIPLHCEPVEARGADDKSRDKLAANALTGLGRGMITEASYIARAGCLKNCQERWNEVTSTLNWLSEAYAPSEVCKACPQNQGCAEKQTSLHHEALAQAGCDQHTDSDACNKLHERRREMDEENRLMAASWATYCGSVARIDQMTADVGGLLATGFKNAKNSFAVRRTLQYEGCDGLTDEDVDLIFTSPDSTAQRMKLPRLADKCKIVKDMLGSNLGEVEETLAETHQEREDLEARLSPKEWQKLYTFGSQQWQHLPKEANSNQDVINELEHLEDRVEDSFLQLGERNLHSVLDTLRNVHNRTQMGSLAHIDVSNSIVHRASTGCAAACLEWILIGGIIAIVIGVILVLFRGIICNALSSFLCSSEPVASTAKGRGRGTGLLERGSLRSATNTTEWITSEDRHSLARFEGVEAPPQSFAQLLQQQLGLQNSTSSDRCETCRKTLKVAGLVLAIGGAVTVVGATSIAFAAAATSTTIYGMSATAFTGAFGLSSAAVAAMWPVVVGSILGFSFLMGTTLCLVGAVNDPFAGFYLGQCIWFATILIACLLTFWLCGGFCWLFRFMGPTFLQVSSSVALSPRSPSTPQLPGPENDMSNLFELDSRTMSSPHADYIKAVYDVFPGQVMPSTFVEVMSNRTQCLK